MIKQEGPFKVLCNGAMTLKPLTNCVTLGQFLHLSVSQYLHLENGNNKGNCSLKLPWRLNELIHVKCLE